MTYIEDMRAEADKRREQAKAADDEGLKRWLLSRAAFFDACADDAEKDDTSAKARHANAKPATHRTSR